MLHTLLSSETKWFLFDFSSTEACFKTVFLWLAVALALTYLICRITFKREDSKKALNKTGLIATIVYSCMAVVTSMVFWFINARAENEFIATLFIPLTVLIVVIAVSLLLIVLQRNRAVYIGCGVAVGLAVVATLVCMAIHFATGKGAEMNWITNEDVGSLPLYISAVLLTGAIVAVAFLCDKGGKPFDTKSISYAAVCIAMSFALSYVRIVKMPQGGSITIASLLPIMVYSCMFGARKGIFAGMIYGILQAVQDPYIIHPAQFVLDYPIAFAGIGLAGVFMNVKAFEKSPQIQFVLGACVAGIARFVMHYISGVFAFGAFAGEQSPYIYSLVYQAGYVLPDIAIAIVVGVFVFSSQSFVKQIRRGGEIG